MSRLLRRDGQGPPPRMQWLLDGVWLRLQRVLSRDLEVVSPGLPSLRLRAGSIDEYNRATYAFAGEPGTVRWLLETLRPGDVFYDIGANIGTFALLAAARVGPAGYVYAFEPHAGTLPALLHNVVANGRQGVIEVAGFPLHDCAAVLPFHYRSIAPASGLSQLNAHEDPHGRAQAPEMSELKAAVALDEAADAADLRPPTVVKLDVDGNELEVLRGMRRLLSGAARPRALQVEVNLRGRRELLAFLDEVGYVEDSRHLTREAQRQVDAGRDPATLLYNGIFVPRSTGTTSH